MWKINKNPVSGLKKVPSHCPRQVHIYFPSEQVTFHSHQPDGQEIKQVICLQNHWLKEQTKTCPGQANFESYLSRGQAGI